MHVALKRNLWNDLVMTLGGQKKEMAASVSFLTP